MVVRYRMRMAVVPGVVGGSFFSRGLSPLLVREFPFRRVCSLLRTFARSGRLVCSCCRLASFGVAQSVRV